MIKSRARLFSPSNFGFIFILILDSVLFILFFQAIKKPYFEAGIIFGFVVFIVVNGLFLIYYLMANPRWVLNNNILTIRYIEGTEYIIDLKEVVYLSVTGRKDIILIFNFPARVDSIELKTKARSYFITIDNYKNTGQLQKELSKFYFKKVENDFIIEAISNDKFDNLTTLNKWHIFNFHTVLFIIMSFFLISVGMDIHSKYKFIFYISAFGLLMFAGKLCTYMSYNDKYFIIKNNIYFWKQKVIRFDDVIGIIHVHGGRAPDSLILTFKDFEKYSFIPNSVGLGNLEDFFKICKEKGISIS